ncbi:MAG: Rossmann fold nucleotide-binding protein Smf possibly involved in DNA uptake [uncultured Chloroflexia bacterium]|uniref:Rossmann fold nucleotide-binding protein Smf possibly involved in DNA uptake n=1 Tax=uncultured Chloroflexia bacterium TaxID=1672391 RepID=A0A6J4J3Z2_9CHLR|nr:MAG: Rossmann fold nucleotide-binding protein Smf possibly involved in DNA uptake [uncultured Chloroflexia bacterium]
MDNTLYYLGFNLVNGIGPARLDRLVSAFGSLQSAWHAPAADLMLAGLDGRTVEALLKVRRTRDLQMEYSRILAAGVRPISRDDPAYPALLRELVNGPPLLYVRGTLAESDRWALAVVGTRGATTYGRDATRKLVADLVAAGVTIVSKLARQKCAANVLSTTGYHLTFASDRAN